MVTVEEIPESAPCAPDAKGDAPVTTPDISGVNEAGRAADPVEPNSSQQTPKLDESAASGNEETKAAGGETDEQKSKEPPATTGLKVEEDEAKRKEKIDELLG
eukprot:9488745-Pyramimonas_sp.AAC.1